MRKGITAHARLKKEAYQPRNTYIHIIIALAGSLFRSKKRHHAKAFRVDPRGDPEPLLSIKELKSEVVIYLIIIIITLNFCVCTILIFQFLAAT